MKVYIASVFADKERVKMRAKDLSDVGITCTSRWALETVSPHVGMSDCTDSYLQGTAVKDIQDILSSDAMVLIIPTPYEMTKLNIEQLARGGRHFESGVMYGLMLAKHGERELIIVGVQPENIFHMLTGEGLTADFPRIKRFSTWEQTLEYLEGRNQ